MTTTRTLDQIHTEIIAAYDANATSGPEMWGEGYRTLADLWGEVAHAEASGPDRNALLCLAARLLADRYAADATGRR